MAIGKVRYGRLTEAGRTAAEMSSENRVLAAREFGVSVDGTTLVLKIGDGVTPWNDLPAIGGGSGGGGSYIEADGPDLPTGQPNGTIWYNTAPAV
jgi:hypothetical protein